MASASTIESIASQWKVLIDPLVGDQAFSEKVAAGRFHNPAAYHVHNAAQAVVAYIVEGEGEEAAFTELDDLARIIALRVSAPSASFACFFELRTLVIQELGSAEYHRVAKDVNGRLNACILHAFDAYVEAREKLSSIANNELKKRNEMLEKLAYGSSAREGGALS